MAGPPFTIDTLTPASTDVVSAYPANEQLNRSNILAWLTFLSDPTTGIIKTQALPNTAIAIPGFIQGLTLSNTATALTTSLDIAAGQATSQNLATPISIVLATALLGKSLGAGWAVGPNTGMLDTGTVADGTYHIFLISRSDTGVEDVCASLSATTPSIGGNIPVAYDGWRRIGSIRRVSGAIVAFRQYGDVFKQTNVSDFGASSARAISLLTVSVPTGIRVQPLLTCSTAASVSSDILMTMADADAASPSAASIIVVRAYNGQGTQSFFNTNFQFGGFFTNTSAQIYMAVIYNSGTPAAINQVQTSGWIDNRGAL